MDEIVQFEHRRRRRRKLLAGAVACVAVLGLSLLYGDTLRELIEPAPAPYEPSMQVAFDRWMQEAFPHFVAEASRADEARFEAAAQQLAEASAFHAGLGRRVAQLCDALRGVKQYIKESELLAKKRHLRTHLDDIDRAMRALELMLHEMQAPYSVDYSAEAQNTGRGWRLRFLARTSRTLGRSTFETEGHSFEVLRVERIDNLSLIDLAHGVARNGIARVHVGGIREQVHNRYLPAMAHGGELRDLFKAADRNNGYAEIFRQHLRDMFPAALRAHLDRVGELAGERRRALEDLNRVLQRYDAYLIEPTDFFQTQAWLDDFQRQLAGYPEVVAQLRRFSPETDISEDDKRNIEAVSAHLIELLAHSVELHEAWHLLRPDPKSRDNDLPQGGASEAVAYLGMLADAGSELPLVDDRLFRVHQRFMQAQRVTQTSIALKAVVDNIEAISIPRGRNPRQRRRARAQWLEDDTARLQRNKTRARELLKIWFDEERHLEKR